MRRDPSASNTGASTTAVVVPLRSFSDAKRRLAGVLEPGARAALARAMAERVVLAASGHPVVVVSSAPEVVAWASARDLAVVADPGTLDAAAGAGRNWARARGCARVAVVHGDLPLVSSLDVLTAGGGAGVAVVVPDHRDDGTPALSLPVEAAFRFAYGPGSARRHVAEAERCRLAVRIVRDEALGFDVDVAADLDTLDGSWADLVR